MNSKLDSFKKPFVIIGLGKSGLAAAKLLKLIGINDSDLRLFDEKKSTDLKSWDDFNTLPVGTLVVSPGVALNNKNILHLKKNGWTITSEISLACQFITDEKIIGVTGSVAKSTVTSLIGIGALNEDVNAFVGGNLGTPFCEYAISLLTGTKKAQWIILELSSYQLENCIGLTLAHSAITFLSSNHLERYPSKHEYYLTKCGIGHLTKGLCFINSNSSDLIYYKNFIACQVCAVSAEGFKEKSLINNIQLLGSHNRDNFAMAYEIAKACGFSTESISKMAFYKGLPHRLEIVTSHKNITYINDSKATAMDSVLVAVSAALEKTHMDGVVHLLLGGRDKNLPWEDLLILNSNSKIVITYFGECGQLAKEKMGNLTRAYFQTLNLALPFVFSEAKPNDVILLSPGGTSLDEFSNFEERGNFFKTKVLEFIQKND